MSKRWPGEREPLRKRRDFARYRIELMRRKRRELTADKYNQWIEGARDMNGPIALPLALEEEPA